MRYFILALLFAGCSAFQTKKEEPAATKTHSERQDFVSVAYTKIEALIYDTSNKKSLYTKKEAKAQIKTVSYEIKRMIRNRAVSITFKIEDNCYVAQITTELFSDDSNTEVVSVENINIKISDAEEFLHKLKVALRKAI